MSIDDESYNKRLSSAIDQCYRTPHGQFLLQHILRIGGLMELESVEKRQVAVQFMHEMLGCRNGPAIVRTALNQLVSISQEEEIEDDGAYDPLGNAGILEHR